MIGVLPRCAGLRQLGICACACAGLWLFPLAAGAQGTAADGGGFSYTAEGVDIRELLRALGTAQGYSVVVSDEVTGLVSGSFVDVDPDRLLNDLATAYGLTWYRDGAVLYVYGAHEVQSAFLLLEYLTPEEALEMLRKLNLFDPRFTIRALSDPPLLYVSGPPHYVQSIRAVVTATEGRRRRQEVRQEEVRYFPLTHAWAGDMRLPLRDKEVVVPGVATLLRRVMTQRDEGGSNVPRALAFGAEGAGNRGGPFQRPVAPSAGAPAAGAPGRRETVDAFPTEEPPLGELFGPESGGGEMVDDGAAGYPYDTAPSRLEVQLDPDIEPSIEADTRRNAVIVRDTAARMDLYEQLIRELDVPVRLVEIQASILDVNADLAFDWGLRAEAGYQDQHNEGSVGIDTTGGLLDADATLQAGEITASWLVLNDHLRFLAAVKALEGRGEARILSRPSLITFANLEAELRDDQTFNARVAGFEDVELFSVTAGVQLRVTPTIIDPVEPGGPTSIQLVVHIEDGAFEDTTVDGLPVVRTSAINTQAVVHHDQSLLIGGYMRESRTDNRRGVPGISKVPILGGLFRSHGKERQMMQRMFLLTPRVVELDASDPDQLLQSSTAPGAEERLLEVLEGKLPEKIDESTTREERGREVGPARRDLRQPGAE